MFTGIIETLGNIVDISTEDTNVAFKISSTISSSLSIDQSVAHNGVCLTVTKVESDAHWVTAIQETLIKSNLNHLKKGDYVNLERCLRLQDRLDGHLVQGHVDTTGITAQIEDKNGSWMFTFSFPQKWATYIVDKGSICINGVSLTIVSAHLETLEVAIIPYTYENTIFKFLKVGDPVNLEFDIVGKYILRNEEIKKRME